MSTEEIVESILKGDKISLSSIKINEIPGFLNYIKGKKLTKLFESSIVESFNWGRTIIDVIYSTIHPFYLHLNLTDESSDIWSCTIYYDIKQGNEVELFLKQLINNLKNDRIKS